MFPPCGAGLRWEAWSPLGDWPLASGAAACHLPGAPVMLWGVLPRATPRESPGDLEGRRMSVRPQLCDFGARQKFPLDGALPDLFTIISPLLAQALLAILFNLIFKLKPNLHTLKCAEGVQFDEFWQIYASVEPPPQSRYRTFPSFPKSPLVPYGSPKAAPVLISVPVG